MTDARKALESAIIDLICDDVLPAYDIPSEAGRSDIELPYAVAAAIDAALASGEQKAGTVEDAAVALAAQRIFEVMVGGKVDWMRHAADTNEDNLFNSADWDCCLRYARASLSALIPAPSVAEAAEPVTRPSVLTIVSEALSDATDVLKAVHDWQAGSEILPIDLWTQVRDFLRKAGRI